MRVYFLSEIPCALLIGGAYLGLVNGFERSAELDLSSSPFCEFTPLGEFLPLKFSIDESFLCAPPRGVTLYYSGQELAIYASGFLRADQSLRVLWQRRFQNALLTLVRQGSLQLYFENGVHEIISLPDFLSDCSVQETNLGFLLVSDQGFALITFDGKLSVVSQGSVLSHETTLRAEIPFHDCLSHSAICEWKDGALISCSIKANRQPTESTFALALFESALIGADCAPYLDENLLPKASLLREYLGDFQSVVLTNEPDRVGLCYERRERVYDVRYYRVKLNNGKISNIIPESE